VKISFILSAALLQSCLFSFDAEKMDALILFDNFGKAYPEDPTYLYSLGKSYYDLQEWKPAIEAFEKALKLQPHNSDAELLLAYSVMFQSDSELKRSQALFQEVLKAVPDYADAKQGLETIEKKLALKEAPKAEIAKKEEKKEPELAPILLERAKNLSALENHAGAIEIYQYLTEKEPKNAEYFFFLGREYVRAGCRLAAKEFFEHSLSLKSDYSDSLIYLGRHYFTDKDYYLAGDFYSRAIESNPKDVAGFVGLARVKALTNEFEDAEELFEIAYSMEPDNVDVLVPFASFFLSEHRYSEAEELYRIYEVNNDDDEIYRVNIFDTSAYTTPTFYAKAGTAQEREKDIFTHRWVASLRYYNTEVGGIFPVSDTLRIIPRVRSGTQRQRLLVSKRTQFDVKSVGGGLKAEWIFDRDWTLIADLSMEWISNNHCPVLLPTKRGIKVEPTLVFRYADLYNTVLFGETSDSIIFRDFQKQHVRVVTRDAATFSYQRDFEDYRYFGANLAWIWYQDRIHNQGQDASVFFQAGIPYIEDLLSARYQCDYRHFYHETTGYYSFQYQLTHWLKMRSVKHWLSGAHYEVEYWHGWRTTKGRNPQQQLVVSPITLLAPVTTVENQIDQIFVTFGYMPNDSLDISFGGTYYHDSFDYTIMGAKLQVDWRF
jgi:tetratricopeptide (TPR) repeat protein